MFKIRIKKCPILLILKSHLVGSSGFNSKILNIYSNVNYEKLVMLDLRYNSTHSRLNCTFSLADSLIFFLEV